MSNDYFNATGAPATRSSGTSSPLRTQFASLEDAFDLLPALGGVNGLQLIRRNAAGTALEGQADSGVETTFTPTLTGIGSPVASLSGRISKFGPYAFVTIAGSWTGGTNATAFGIGNLPFTAVNASCLLSVAVNQNSSAFTWTGQLVARLDAVPSTSLSIYQMQSGGTFTTTPLLNPNAGTKDIRINGVFIVG